MFRRLPFLLVALSPSVAVAQIVAGSPYIGVGGGLNFSGSPVSAEGLTRFDTNTGGVGLAALGWVFDNGLRAELEGSYRSNGIGGIDTQRVNGALSPLTNPTGSLNTWAIMVNGEYDIPLSRLGFLAVPVQPYIGGGVGYAWLDTGNAGGNGFATLAVPPGNRVTGPTVVSFGSTGAFAYQAIAGLSVPLTARWEATLEYRFFGTAEADLPVTRVIPTALVNGAVPMMQSRNRFELHDNAVLFGLRYRFF